MIRLFIALLIPDEIQSRLINQCKNIFTDYTLYQWEKKEKIHLTLKFIGGFAESKLSALIDELSFLEEVKQFKCSLAGLGFFYNNDEPKILWAGLNTENRLIHLIDNLNSRLEKFKIRPDKRKFKPHITLLRIKKN